MRDAVVRLLLIICIFTVDETEVIIAGRAFELEFGTLQVIVIALVLGENADAAAVGTTNELLGALAEMAEGFALEAKHFVEMRLLNREVRRPPSHAGGWRGAVKA